MREELLLKLVVEGAGDGGRATTDQKTASRAAQRRDVDPRRTQDVQGACHTFRGTPFGLERPLGIVDEEGDDSEAVLLVIDADRRRVEAAGEQNNDGGST